MKTAEEFYKNLNPNLLFREFNKTSFKGEDVKLAMIEFAKYHVQAALKAASNIHLSADNDEEVFDKMGIVMFSEDAEEYNTFQILTSYPLENIK